MSCDYERSHEHGHSHHHSHPHGYDRHHGHHGHGHHGYHGYGGHRAAECCGYPAGGREAQRPTLRVRQGDVLACGCRDCNVEFTVTKACEGDACGTGCEVAVSCCGEPMTRKAA